MRPETTSRVGIRRAREDLRDAVEHSRVDRIVVHVVCPARPRAPRTRLPPEAPARDGLDASLPSRSTSSLTFFEVDVERSPNDHERATCDESSDDHVNNSLFDILDEASEGTQDHAIPVDRDTVSVRSVALKYPLIGLGICLCCLMVYLMPEPSGGPGADRTTVTRACPESHGTRSKLYPRRFDLPTDRSSGTRRDLGHRLDRSPARLPGSGSAAATTQHPHGSPSSAVITD